MVVQGWGQPWLFLYNLVSCSVQENMSNMKTALQDCNVLAKPQIHRHAGHYSPMEWNAILKATHSFSLSLKVNLLMPTVEDSSLSFNGFFVLFIPEELQKSPARSDLMSI